MLKYLWQTDRTAMGLGGNLSLEVRAAFQRKKKNVEIKSVVYGLGGIDFDVSDGRWLWSK